ncbi:MAG: hypothetical protein EBT07_05390 [Actinobacteria bacterium]|nr:hypothetical protein [Actinomycetota bacterium]
MPPYKRSDYYNVAVEYAKMAVTRLNTSLHIAFVYGRGGILLAMSTNRIGTRSSGAGFSTMTIHAERAALKAVGDFTLLRGAVLVVVRIGRGGNLEKAMDKYGLRCVYYS